MQTNHRRMTSTLLVRVQEQGAMLTTGSRSTQGCNWTEGKMRAEGLAGGFQKKKKDAEKSHAERRGRKEMHLVLMLSTKDTLPG